MIKVITVDDHPVVRSGIKDIVDDENDMIVVNEASSVAELFDALQTHNPDVILLDISLPGISGYEALPKILNRFPHIKIVMLSALAEDVYASKSLDAGAMAFLSKETSPEELPQAIRKVMKGEVYVSPNFAEKLAMKYIKGGEKKSIDDLSQREFQVFATLGAGFSVGEVAEKLNLSVKTVSTYRSRILEKMGMQKNVEIIRYCINHNLL